MKHELITPNEIKKILELSAALDLELLCTITDNIIRIRTYDRWKVKIYECSNDYKREIFDMINGYYRARNNKQLNK
jgi:hypothetical protein